MNTVVDFVLGFSLLRWEEYNDINSGQFGLDFEEKRV